MKVTSANAAFSMLLNFITHKYVVASKAADVRIALCVVWLDRYWMIISQDRSEVRSKCKAWIVERDKVLVVLADELDYLFTKNQHVIYKLFDWPSDPHSQLIVIVLRLNHHWIEGNFEHDRSPWTNHEPSKHQPAVDESCAVQTV